MPRGFNTAAATAALLLILCPIRNLRGLRECFGTPGIVMDVPAEQLHLETSLVLLQVCFAALGGLAFGLGAAGRLIGASVSWGLVAVLGFVWDKALGNFIGEALPKASALACVLEQRSAHTHTMLTNGPLLMAAALALWAVRESLRLRSRATGTQ